MIIDAYATFNANEWEVVSRVSSFLPWESNVEAMTTNIKNIALIYGDLLNCPWNTIQFGIAKITTYLAIFF